MNTSNNGIRDFIVAMLNGLKNWFSKYAKIIMPIVLLICVAVTVVVAIRANQKKEDQDEAAVATPNVEAANELIEVPEVPLEQDAVPEVNALMDAYYTAMVEGDTDTMERLVDHLDATEILRAQETSKYIEDYPTLEVYTKAGPKEDSYLAYVYAELKFYDYEKAIPGMQVYYVCKNENGDYYINQDGEESESEIHYIRQINLQDDVVDLNNRAAVAYNDMLAEDEKLASFILDLNAEIDKNVGEALARAEGSEQDKPEETSEEGNQPALEKEGQTERDGQEGQEQEEPATVVTKVKATDVVNIRTSDSETADKLGKAAIGDEFTLLEERGNGWSKVEYEGGEAFIKSDYLEPSETQTASNGDDTETSSDNGETQPETTDTVTVIENVRIRKSANENSEKLGTAFMGEKLELIMKQADGWTKIKYNGETAYVKSEYVE